MKKEIEVKVMNGFLQRLRGLEFRDADEKNYLFNNCNCIHTFGMRKPIDVAFINDEGIVLQVNRRVSSKKVLSLKQARMTIERFSSNKPWLEVSSKYSFKEGR